MKEITEASNKAVRQLAMAEEAYILDVLRDNMVKDENGKLVWKEHVKLRLEEIKDYKAEVRAAIDKIEKEYDNDITVQFSCFAIKKELDL